LEINNDAFGKPVITLSRKSIFKLNKKKVELTISHDRNYAIALVAVEGR
jgi:holo-[acyl-carrier-protein] synthase